MLIKRNYQNKIKQYGLVNSIKRLIRKLLRIIGYQYESYILLGNKLDEIAINSKILKYDFSNVRKLCFDDFVNSASPDFSCVKMNLFRERFNSGKFKSFGIYDNGRLIYSTWISFDKITFSSFSDRSIPLKNDQALLEDSFCHPSFRGKGLHSKMNLFRLKTISDLGYSEAIAVVVRDNIPAMKTQLNDNFTFRKKITIRKFLGKEFFIEKSWNDPD